MTFEIEGASGKLTIKCMWSGMSTAKSQNQIPLR